MATRIEPRHIEWISYDDGWRAEIGRCVGWTWPFGSVWQAKVMVCYAHALFEHEGVGPSVGICLDPSATPEQAMARVERWVARYDAEGPPGPDVVVDGLLAAYPSLFSTREDCLEQVFFLCGGGFTWLDGAVVDRSPDDRVSSRSVAPAIGDWLADARALLEKLGVSWLDEPRSAPSADTARDFYVSREFSNIARVPPDVRNDWLAAAIDAAELLRDRAADPETREFGVGVAADLRRRRPR